MPFEPEIVTVSSNYTVLYGNKVILVDTATATGNVTISLLEIGNGANQAGLGYTITIKDIGFQASTKNIIINAYSGDNIDSATSLTLNDNGHALMAASNGSSANPVWMAMNFYANWTSMMPVTKTGENYLGLSGQQLTANAIDLAGSNVTGILPVGKIPTAIPATSIGDGSVDNTEFSYLNGVTSAIQTQLDSKVGSFSNQTANTVFSGPTTGGAAAPAFRALVVADLPVSGVSAGSVPATGQIPTFTVNTQGQVTVIGSTTNGSALTGLNASNVTTGTLPVAQIPTGIPAANIGTGVINNTEFGYLDGVTSSIQAQLDSKANAVSRSFSNPARSLNTAFQISTTRDTMVAYSVNITVAAVLIAGQSGTAVLEYADNSGITTNVVTVASSTNSTSGVLSITNIGTGNLAGIIPANKYVRVRTVNNTGTPTFGIANTQEVLL